MRMRMIVVGVTMLWSSFCVRHAAAGDAHGPIKESFVFAYYPSSNQLEVRIDVGHMGKAAVHDSQDIEVFVVPRDQKEPVASGKIRIDQNHVARALIDLPNLRDGEYAVEYSWSGQRGRCSKTFPRIHFPWENNSLGLEHTVYPPFEPIRVRGTTVAVVGRTYQMNSFGMFDSVQSKGRELLAAPIRVVCETAQGTVAWEKLEVSGKAEYADGAVFTARAVSSPVVVQTRSSIEEDGCVKIEMDLLPVAQPQEIQRLWIEIPLKDAEAPLFHYIADEDTMRNNFGGATPRGGRIVWDVESQPETPPTWRVEPGPQEGAIWDSSQVKHATGPHAGPFVAYLWLGAEERGLCWFGENDRGYVVDADTPTQVLLREQDRLILCVNLIQRPIVLTETRRIVFGLQASPTKPMPENWRSRMPPTGWEPCVPWGGYDTSSKYPDNRDFSVVERLVKTSRTGVVDEEFFRTKDKLRLQKDRKVNGDQSWLESVRYFANWFANFAASGAPRPLTTYFEIHGVDTTIPEHRVFQDEWDPDENFSRFRRNGSGLLVRSYQDFAVYYANEWFKRGVGVYFDNCYPKRTHNPRFSSAYYGENDRLRYSLMLWDARNYYKRVWKLAQAWNRREAGPCPREVFFHMTNTQVLPLNTWSTFTLDLEQRYRDDLPWPPEYTRAVTLSRQIGSVPVPLNPLRNGIGSQGWFQKAGPHAVLSNLGMCVVHEFRGLGAQVPDEGPSRRFATSLAEFGYRTRNVAAHDYWEENPFVRVHHANVKWLALTREHEPSGLLILQSYEAGPVVTKVHFPAALSFQDAETNQLMDANADGEATIDLPADYGTRMLLVSRRTTKAAPAKLH